MTKMFYHTQEARKELLQEPIPCKRDDAWLGEASYFWLDLYDADYWGNMSKRKTGYYEIYHCQIDCENVLDSVFNEEHYNFWFKQIEKVAKVIIARTKMKPTIKELNDYLKEKGAWDELDGILFQDLPTNPNALLVKPIEYRNRRVVFPYRKRIQIAVYNSNILSNFALLKKEKCI